MFGMCNYTIGRAISVYYRQFGTFKRLIIGIKPFDFISVIKKNTQISYICNVYKLKNNYYLHIPDDSEKLNHYAWEYGEKSENICHEWLIEHCKNLGKVYLQ